MGGSHLLVLLLVVLLLVRVRVHVEARGRRHHRHHHHRRRHVPPLLLLLLLLLVRVIRVLLLKDGGGLSLRRRRSRRRRLLLLLLLHGEAELDDRLGLAARHRQVRVAAHRQVRRLRLRARRERALGFLGAGAADDRGVDAEETEALGDERLVAAGGGAAPSNDQSAASASPSERLRERRADDDESRVEERRAVCTCSPSLVFAVCAKRTRRSGPPGTGSTPTLCERFISKLWRFGVSRDLLSGWSSSMRSSSESRRAGERPESESEVLRSTGGCDVASTTFFATHSWIAPSVLAVVPVASGDISGGSSSSEEIESEFSRKSESRVSPEIGVVSVCVMGSELGGFMNVGWDVEMN